MEYGVIDIGSNTIRLSIFKYNEEKNIVKLVTNKKVIVGLTGYVKKGQLSALGITKLCRTLQKLKMSLENFEIKNYSAFATASLRNISNTEEVLKEIEIGITKLCRTLQKLKMSLENFEIKNYSAFATASLRNISNTEEVLKEIEKTTGIKPEIIVGEEEARLDFIGAKSGMNLERGILVDIGGGSTEIVLFNNGEIEKLTSIPIGALNLQNKVVKHIVPEEKEIKVDIGGGSTEIVLFNNGEIEKLTSIPIGALNLQNKVVKHIVPEEKEIKKMRKIIKEALKELNWEHEQNYKYLYGIGGSLRACMNIIKETKNLPLEDKSFFVEELYNIVDILKNGGTCEETKELYRLIPERIFSFAGGVVILREIVDTFGVEKVIISKNGVREGYFIDRVIKKDEEKVENNEA